MPRPSHWKRAFIFYFACFVAELVAITLMVLQMRSHCILGREVSRQVIAFCFFMPSVGVADLMFVLLMMKLNTVGLDPMAAMFNLVAGALCFFSFISTLCILIVLCGNVAQLFMLSAGMLALLAAILHIINGVACQRAMPYEEKMWPQRAPRPRRSSFASPHSSSATTPRSSSPTRRQSDTTLGRREQEERRGLLATESPLGRGRTRHDRQEACTSRSAAKKKSAKAEKKKTQCFPCCRRKPAQRPHTHTSPECHSQRKRTVRVKKKSKCAWCAKKPKVVVKKRAASPAIAPKEQCERQRSSCCRSRSPTRSPRVERKAIGDGCVVPKPVEGPRASKKCASEPPSSSIVAAFVEHLPCMHLWGGKEQDWKRRSSSAEPCHRRRRCCSKERTASSGPVMASTSRSSIASKTSCKCERCRCKAARLKPLPRISSRELHSAFPARKCGGEERSCSRNRDTASSSVMATFMENLKCPKLWDGWRRSESADQCQKRRRCCSRERRAKSVTISTPSSRTSVKSKEAKRKSKPPPSPKPSKKEKVKKCKTPPPSPKPSRKERRAKECPSTPPQSRKKRATSAPPSALSSLADHLRCKYLWEKVGSWRRSESADQCEKRRRCCSRERRARSATPSSVSSATSVKSKEAKRKSKPPPSPKPSKKEKVKKCKTAPPSPKPSKKEKAKKCKTPPPSPKPSKREKAKECPTPPQSRKKRATSASPSALSSLADHLRCKYLWEKVDSWRRSESADQCEKRRRCCSRERRARSATPSSVSSATSVKCKEAKRKSKPPPSPKPSKKEKTKKCEKTPPSPKPSKKEKAKKCKTPPPSPKPSRKERAKECPSTPPQSRKKRATSAPPSALSSLADHLRCKYLWEKVDGWRRPAAPEKCERRRRCCSRERRARSATPSSVSSATSVKSKEAGCKAKKPPSKRKNC